MYVELIYLRIVQWMRMHGWKLPGNAGHQLMIEAID
jgi:hypothetical protein